jgi:glycosyltransferase involved in cell wall biosynthesis
MSERTLLILTYHFPPSAASGTHRLLGFVRHLPKFGWRSVVVAPPGLPWEPSDEALLNRVPTETAIYPVPYPVGRLWKPIRRFYPWGVWLPLAWARCRRAIRDHRPDAVLTSGPPHHVHLLGQHLRRWQGLPWVADFRDPWAVGHPSLISKQESRRGWEFRAEAAVLSDADAIVTNTPRGRSLLSKAYPQHASKMVSITNGYDPENFLPNENPPLSGPTVDIAHLGEVYADRDPGPFLEAICQLKCDEAVNRTFRVRFIGNFSSASQQADLENQIRADGLHDVVSLGSQVPYAQSLRAMAEADILLLVDNPGRPAGVPAKLYEYIGAGRPILALADYESDVAWILSESGLPYRIAPPRDPEAIRRALCELLKDPTTAAYRKADHSPTRFTREQLSGELSQLLNSCLKEPATRSSSAAPLEHVV